MSLSDQLKELAERLQAEGRDKDAALVFSAYIATMSRTPAYQKLEQAAPGFYVYSRVDR